MAVILQHCSGKSGAGGPATALNRFLDFSSVRYPVIWQDRPAGGFSIKLLNDMIREIRMYRPDLIHVRGLGNEGFHATLAARFAKVPKILVSIHGSHRDLVRPKNKLRKSIVSNVLEPFTLANASAIVTVCEFASNREFLRPYKHKMLPPVPNGVVLPKLIHNIKDMKCQYSDLLSNSLTAITVSRLTREKGYEDLAASLKIIQQRGYAMNLIIVGSGEDENEIKSYFKGLNKIAVKFVGHQNDVSTFLQMADFFVFPTWSENLSNALLEAMACGLPVIATDVGGNREIVNKGGGIIVPVRDTLEFANSIETLLNSSEIRAELSNSALNTILNNYTVDHMVRGWEHTYNRILGED